MAEKPDHGYLKVALLVNFLSKMSGAAHIL